MFSAFNPCKQIRFHYGFAIFTLVLVSLVATASMSRAAMTNVAFNLRFSEKEMALSHGDSMEMMKFAMWDLGFERMTNRSLPFLELSNDSTSDAPITEFRMTIGDERFNFSDDYLSQFAVLSSYSSPGVSISSTVEDGGNELVISFGGGGLQAGESAIFGVDVDFDISFSNAFFPGAPTFQPDFRTVLFDMNGRNVYDANLIDFDTADNAMVNVTYNTPGMDPVTVGPTAMEDVVIIGTQGQFYNDIFRSYGIMEPVDTFQISGSGSAIPEPSTVVLALLGLLGGIAVARGRSRRR